MFISDFAIKKPIVTVTVMLALVIFGLIALVALKTDEFPDVQPPVVAVTIVYPGASPETVERELIDPIEDAIFSISETRWGLMAGIILPQLCQAIGLRQVRRYALSGERFGAQEARRIGLVHEVVPAGELQNAGERLVGQLLQNAPEANAQTKAVALEFAWGAIDEAALERLVVQHAAKRRSREAAEGLASFHEKRPARW